MAPRQEPAAPAIAVTSPRDEAIDHCDAASPQPSSSRPSTSDGSLSPTQPSSNTSADSCPPSTPQSQSQPQSDGSTSDGTTAVEFAPSSQHIPSPPRSPSPSGSFSSRDSRRTRSWRDHLPGSTATQNLVGVGVAAVTIVALDYAHRSDVSQRWNNLIAWYAQWCQGTNTSMACRNVKTKLTPLPPYTPLEDAFQGTKRSLDRDATEQDTMYAFSKHAILELAMAAVLFGAFLALASLGGLNMAKRRRNRRKTKESQSMARREYGQSSATGVGGNASDKVRRRFRAFVTAEEAIPRMKSISGSDAMLTGRDSRRVSGKRGSWLAGDNSSLYEGAGVFMYDASQDDRWKRVSRADCKLHPLPNPEASRNPPLTPADCRGDQLHRHQHLDRLARRFNYEPSSIFDTPPREVGAGDFIAAMAYVGASLAATTGGMAMSRVPVEITLDSDHDSSETCMCSYTHEHSDRHPVHMMS